VYGALKGSTTTKMVEQTLKNFPIYALYPDIEARGMQDRVIDGIKLVDYSGFVDLVAEHTTIQAWL
jgi:tRNA 2-thiouridine synthesizing protein B